MPVTSTDMPRIDAATDLQRAVDRAHELASAYLAGLPTRPATPAPDPAALRAALDEPLPEAGSDPAEAVAEWLRRADGGITASSGPRFFGFVTGGVTPAALAGDWLTSTIDQNAAMWLSSPAASETEAVVLRWLKELFHLPMEWGGALTSGATMANLVGLAAARQWTGERLGFDPAVDGLGGHPAIPVVSSTEIHSSAVKALSTLGLGRGSVRKVRANVGVVDLGALGAALAEIDGPAIVVGNAAEVNTGQFDDLTGLADLCAAHPGGAWLHVDAAFGLFAAATPRLRHLLAGIERADSVAADGHKWLNVPYDSGFAFVRDTGYLKQAFSVSAAYTTGSADTWDPMSHLPEMSKRFRGLAAWCALKAYGRAGYREMVERCVDNAAAFAGWVAATPGLELMSEATLNIVCFRYAPAGLDDAATDAFNREAIRRLHADGRVFVTGTVWDGRAALRPAFDNWSTTADDVRILREAVADMLG